MQSSNTSDYFPFEPTSDQELAFSAFHAFIMGKGDAQVYVLKGAAGTGKTTLMQAFISFLDDKDIEYKLAAPTGRAAKILSSRTADVATTIHNLLYTISEDEDGEGGVSAVRFVRRPYELEEPTVFIIDEASMISDEVDSGNFLVSEKPLLTDLIEYVLQSDPSNKIVFVGDDFQLPPVNTNDSPALNAAYLEQRFQLNVCDLALREVKRQNADSYILNNATILREAIEDDVNPPKLKYHFLDDEDAAVDKYVELYEEYDHTKVGIIGWRNDDVFAMNQKIRQKLFKFDDIENADTLRADDVVMVNRTYFSEDDVYLANGELGVVKSIYGEEELAGLRFAKAEIQFLSETGFNFTHRCKVLLDCLTNPTAQIDAEASKELYITRIKKNKLFRKRKDKRMDTYLNALQLKYGYALTCHKAQGGEWDHVIIHPRVPPRSHDDFKRWLYTAVTRAKEDLYSFRPKNRRRY